MPHPGRMLPAIAGLLTFLLIALSAFALERLNQGYAEQEARAKVSNQAAALRSRLESEMNRTIFTAAVSRISSVPTRI